MSESTTIGIYGAGWVGLVTGACFAELGHRVIVRDVVPERIADLQAGRTPIHEPELGEALERCRDRLVFTLDPADLAEADVSFICVGTPPSYSGDADLSAVWALLAELPQVERRSILVMKSTVPVGTGEKVRAALDARGLGHVGYVSNPEFLAEGRALRDFRQPDRVVIGSYVEADGDAVEALYAGIDTEIVRTDVASAEMVKLASNAFLATRISFINEIANVCEMTGADVEQVALGMGLDRRIGPHFLRAGIGYGGSCLLGEETVLVRTAGGPRLVSLEGLYDAAEPGEKIEILSWRPDGSGAEFLPIDLLTRRHYNGEIVELRTKLGRRLRCTPDHTFVTQDGRKLAEELTSEDWLPLAQGLDIVPRERPRLLNVLGAFEEAGLAATQVIVRPEPTELAAIGVRDLQTVAAVRDHPRGPVARSHDIMRVGALRLHEAAQLDLDLDLAAARYGTARNGTYVPAIIQADEHFWRVVGLYLAEGHYSRDGARERLFWSFHPTDEPELVEEVRAYWAALGVEASVRRLATTTSVTVSSRVLAAWWCQTLGLGRTCYDHRLPDLIWEEGLEAKRALLSGLWQGDGSWSLVAGGPSAVLEYGTVSRELADGMLRLLGDLEIAARLKIGRTAKSTVDTYWLVVSGADQVERLLELVPSHQRGALVETLGRQTKRIAPTGYRRRDNAAWVRVVDVRRQPFSGFVYSLEVPPNHTFVTTGGLVCSNCFPKDVSALKQLAGNSGYHFQLLSAVIEVNELQKRRVVGKLAKHLGTLAEKRIALLGLAFKAHTNDMREASSVVLAGRLVAEGADVTVWDPVADPDGMHGVEVCDSILQAVEGADAAVIVTEWPELRELASDEVRRAMRNPLIVDGRNLLDPAATRAAGFVYEAIGRPSSPLAALEPEPEPEPEPAS